MTEFVIRTSVAATPDMTASQVLLLILSISLSIVTGDYSQDYAYVYPDQEHYYANTSALTHHASSGRTK